jgi:hypothetical protein
MAFVYAPIYLVTSVADVVILAADARISTVDSRVIRTVERRITRDLLTKGAKYGFPARLSKAALQITVGWADFQAMLDEAAIAGILAYYNSKGIANRTAGPITAASGDGMAKTQAYFNQTKRVDSVIAPEENYNQIIEDIFRMYSAYGYGPTGAIASLSNEFLNPDYNANDVDARFNENFDDDS